MQTNSLKISNLARVLHDGSPSTIHHDAETNFSFQSYSMATWVLLHLVKVLSALIFTLLLRDVLIVPMDDAFIAGFDQKEMSGVLQRKYAVKEENVNEGVMYVPPKMAVNRSANCAI